MISADEALRRLREGNDRFASGASGVAARLAEAHRSVRTGDQKPFAVILGCSDSRVPVELVFDQGFGDLFVIRVAGNIVSPSQVGSVEFAAEKFDTRLVVVLGHTRCGAVEAAVEDVLRPGESVSHNVDFIVSRIRPSVEALVAAGQHPDPDELARLAVRVNVRHAADHLRHGSAVLERLIAEEGLRVVEAEYSLESGRVEFFDRPGAPGRG
jgi:carbonic anhydrase